MSEAGAQVCQFISFVTSFQVTVKLAHWMTSSYARHVALDELHDSLQALGDRFIEAWIGRHGRPGGRCVSAIETKAAVVKPDALVPYLRAQAATLERLPNLDDDGRSIRDDMLAATNKALYLLNLG